MQDILNKIFKAYDIRGLLGEQIDENLVYDIGRAFADYISGNEIIVGHDIRTMSPEFADAFARGAAEQGANVIKAGYVSTDMVSFAVGHYGLGGGATITASHNPSCWNGVKMCKEEARSLSGADGLPQIKQAIIDKSFKTVESKGTITEKNIYEDFIKHIFSFVDINNIRGKKIVADAGNGIAGKLVPEVFRHLDIELVPLYFELDGTFPNHDPSPIEEKNLVDLKKKVLEEKADLGMAFDGDADRVFLVTEDAETIPGSFMTALIAESLLEKHPGGNIIYNLICSKIVPEMVKEYKGVPHVSRVGHSFIKKHMRDIDAVFAGEHSGHYYFRDNFYADSGIIAALAILEIICLSGKKASEIISPLKKYHASGEINSKVDDKEAVMEKIVQVFASGNISNLDGISVEFDDFWFNVRPSNTEPLLRLNLEARTEELCKEKTEEVLKVIRE